MRYNIMDTLTCWKWKEIQSKDFPLLKRWAVCVTKGILIKKFPPFLMETPLKYTHITPRRSFPIRVTHISAPWGKMSAATSQL